MSVDTSTRPSGTVQQGRVVAGPDQHRPGLATRRDQAIDDGELAQLGQGRVVIVSHVTHRLSPTGYLLP